MIGYLAAIESRDLLSSTGAGGAETQPRRAAHRTPIMPRLPSEYESWRFPASVEQAETENAQTHEAEERLTLPTIDAPGIRASAERRVEGRPSAKSPESHVENGVSSTRVIDSRLRNGRESSPIMAQSAPRNVESPTAEQLRDPTEKGRHEAVVVHPVSQTPAGIVKTSTESTARSDHSRARRADAIAPVSQPPLIIPKIRESGAVASPQRKIELSARQERGNATAQESEPSVVVTIGRIEVRAVTSPSQARPTAERQPMMSLDDYLKQRMRGVR